MAGSSPLPGTDVEPDRSAPTGTSRWQKVVGILGLAVAVWVGSETHDVVVGDFGGPGPGAHGPGGPGRDTLDQDQDQEPDPDDGGGHRPPAGGHG